MKSSELTPLLFTVYLAAASGRSPALPCFAAFLALVRFSGLFAFTQLFFQTLSDRTCVFRRALENSLLGVICKATGYAGGYLLFLVLLKISAAYLCTHDLSADGLGERLHELDGTRVFIGSCVVLYELLELLCKLVACCIAAC